MDIEYRMREDKVADEDGVLHTVYGFEVWRNGEAIRVIPDVCCTRERAEYYLGLFNELGLSLWHLDDIIEEIV